MTIDTTTGLPELPRGHFWRVERYWPTYGMNGYRVSIQRKLLWWSVGVDYSSQFYDLSFVAKAASDVMVRHANRQARLNEEARILGDYPPKRYNT
jgi:hypothetical protein